MDTSERYLMTQVIEKARELAESIVRSTEYRQLQERKAEAADNHVTAALMADYEEISSDSMQYRATFSVTNRAGKTVSETCTITTQAGTKPLLELTSDSITLSVGDSFYFMSYIKTARDIDGTSLDTRISISGVVDTSTPGTYELEYYTYSRITSERASKVLTIYVQ